MLLRLLNTLHSCHLLLQGDEVHLTSILPWEFSVYTPVMFVLCLFEDTEIENCFFCPPSPLQAVHATLLALPSQGVDIPVTPAAGSALVSPVSAAPDVTAACWDTGGFMSTAVVLVTAQGTVTPTLVTAFLGESQGLIQYLLVLVLR